MTFPRRRRAETAEIRSCFTKVGGQDFGKKIAFGFKPTLEHENL